MVGVGAEQAIVLIRSNKVRHGRIKSVKGTDGGESHCGRGSDHGRDREGGGALQAPVHSLRLRLRASKQSATFRQLLRKKPGDFVCTRLALSGRTATAS